MPRNGRRSNRSKHGNGRGRANYRAQSLNRTVSGRRSPRYGLTPSQRAGGGMTRSIPRAGVTGSNPTPYQRPFPWRPRRMGGPMYERSRQPVRRSRIPLQVPQPNPRQSIQPLPARKAPSNPSDPSQNPATRFKGQNPSLNALQQQKKMLEQMLKDIEARLQQLEEINQSL